MGEGDEVNNPKYVDELAETVADLLDKVKTICLDARMALTGNWDRSDDGFQAQLDLLEPSIEKAEELLDTIRKDLPEGGWNG